jgi:copper chaperone NosL
VRPQGALAVVLAASLGCSARDLSEPPEIAYGLEECVHCRMIISDERHAAAASFPGGGAHRFDDIGCLLSALEAGAEEPRRIWVHDARSLAWLDAHSASFVIEGRESTPMGSGIVAFGSEEAARERAGGDGTIYDWGELTGIGLGDPEEENRG